MSRTALAALDIPVLLIESDVEAVFWLERGAERAVALPAWLDGTPRGDELLSLSLNALMATSIALVS